MQQPAKNPDRDAAAPNQPRFLGIDGCRGGWLGVAIDAARRFDGAPHLWPSSTNLLASLDGWALALIDMPIGLVDAAPGVRGCEVAARRLLGRRRSAIFSPPVRQALDAATYAEACAANAAVCGKKLSIQAWHIMPKIRSIDQELRRQPHLQQRLRESHPELCFAALNRGEPVAANKKTSTGREARLHLLAQHSASAIVYFERHKNRYPRAQVAADDIIDAMVLALTAGQGDRRGLVSLPAAAETDHCGLRMEIVFAEFDAT